MVLVDTSVWVDHLRFGNPRLVSLLEEAAVLSHPFVLGELACGHLPDRARTLRELCSLPLADIAGHDEVMAIIETHRLMNLGVGYIDVHLVASARLSGIPIWTRDQPLRKAAARLGVLFA
jgi:predicted nucleic acid-binding protein